MNHRHGLVGANVTCRECLRPEETVLSDRTCQLRKRTREATITCSATHVRNMHTSCMDSTAV